MINFVEYLKIPAGIAFAIIVVFFIMQVIGEILEFKGKIVPEFLKIRKYFRRKKQEKKLMRELPVMLQEVRDLLNNVEAHYSADNIAMRDKWMKWVNDQAVVYDRSIADLEKKMDKNNEITLELLIENMRSAILDFASYVADEKHPVTHEQFRRIFKKYEDYENIIEENKLTNGEVDIAIRIIRESYEDHMRNHTFVEDVRGYN